MTEDSSEQLEKLMQLSPDMICFVNHEGKITNISNACLQVLGYSAKELIGQLFFAYIQQESRGKTHLALDEASNENRKLIFENQLLHKSGKPVTISWSVNWSEKDKTFFCIGREVTGSPLTDKTLHHSNTSANPGPKENSLTFQGNEQNFKYLFDNNPDMVFLENKEGIILDVNRAVETSFGLPRQEFINRSMAEILPAVHQHPQNVIDRKPVRFEAEVVFKTLGRRILNISKIPLVLDDEVAGTFCVAKDVTAVTHSLNIIKQQALKLNTVFESITDAFFTLDKNWTFTYINSEFDRLLQTNRQEIIGRNIWEVFPEESSGIFYDQYKAALESGTTAHFEAFLARTGLWFEVKAFPSEEGLSVYLSDITNRIHAQEESNKLSIVASKTFNGVIIADKKGIIEWVNESFTHITGYSPEEQYGQSVFSLFTGTVTSEKSSVQLMNKLAVADSFETETSFTSRDGRELWLKISVIKNQDKGGNLSRYIIILTDVTPQKQALLERNSFIEELRSQNKSLQQFSHLVSHKLRAPVANIIGLTSLFRMPEIHDKEIEKQVVEKLEVAANNLDTIIKDLNYILSLRESIGLEKRKTDFNIVLDVVVQQLQDQISHTGAIIRRDFSEAPSIHTVEPYLFDIMYNLLDNALKFRSTERQPLIEIYTRLEDGFMTLVVEDNGIGFNLEKNKNDVFGMYKRFHGHVNGKGLGLYIVKTQVETLGGKVDVKSREAIGSAFKIYFKHNA